MAPSRTPDPTDKHVGARVRMRRLMISMSQEKLADALGLTFQQVQKYEKGANRIGASRLQEISGILQVPVAFFFEDMPHSSSSGQTLPSNVNEFLATSDGLALVKAFQQIKNPGLRRRIVNLVQELADQGA